MARTLPVAIVGVMALVALMALLATSARASSIAFLRGGNIWIAAPDGSAARQLTTNGGYTYVSASKAPGTIVLAYRQGNALGVINADGTGQRQITAPRGLATVPDAEVDPSGVQLAYAALTGYGAYGGYVAISGAGAGYFSNFQSNVVDVGWADSGSTALWAGYLSQAPGEVHHPDCTPAGGTESLGIATQQTNPDGASAANPSSGFFCVPGQDVLSPEGSPDGAKVLATLGPRDGQTRVIEVDRGTMSSFSEPPAPFTYETPPTLTARDPDWSPDMTQLAFDSPGGTIWIARTDGQGQASQVLHDASTPAWSPYTLPAGATTPPGPTTPTAPNSATPNTKLTGMRTNRRRRRVTFTFTAIGKATGFQCALVRSRRKGKAPAPRFRSCRSPKRYRSLARGRYTFSVRAVNGGLRDRSPARRRFTL